MEQPVLIDIQNVSKRYSRSLKLSLWYGIRDVLKEFSGQSQSSGVLRPGEFWALRDISFQVRRGESVGLIGHNGAGKTTLLKLINGLIKPNGGRIAVTGSVRALIALGTGFNPVLSGRENIWIASAVLGYSDEETRQRFDEIVAFSEIGEFINSPVQSYSSGMLARLGFAVAIHTQPDILLVDEVLAVGDLNFAIKCYRKISEFREQGGSIIFVSHNPYAIRTNCDRAVWVENGVIEQVGSANEVCDAYELYVARKDTQAGEQRHVDDAVEVLGLTYPQVINSSDEFVVEIKLHTKRLLESPLLVVSISNISGQILLSNVSSIAGVALSIPVGVSVIRLRYPNLPLVRGLFSLNLVVAEKSINNQLAALINCYKFEIRTDPEDHGVGMFKLQPEWECLHATSS